MSDYGLNQKTYGQRKKDNPEYSNLHDAFTSKLVYHLRRLGCSVYVASDEEQRSEKFDFKTKRKGDRYWVAWDVKVAARLPRQFTGTLTEFNCILSLLTWQGLGRFNNNNHVFWLLMSAQSRRNVTEAEGGEMAKVAAERIITGKTLRGLKYYTRGANRNDRKEYWGLADKPQKMFQALLLTNRTMT